MVSGKLAARENLKRLRAETQFLIHALIVCAGKERHADLQKNLIATGSGGIAFAEGFAANAVGATSALFEHSRIPSKIVMNDVPAVAVQVNAFLPNGCANEDLRQKRGVETVEDAVAGVGHVATPAFDKCHEL